MIYETNILPALVLLLLEKCGQDGSQDCVKLELDILGVMVAFGIWGSPFFDTYHFNSRSFSVLFQIQAGLVL